MHPQAWVKRTVARVRPARWRESGTARYDARVTARLESLARSTPVPAPPSPDASRRCATARSWRCLVLAVAHLFGLLDIGVDAFAYWSADPTSPYGATTDGTLQAYFYSPAFAQLTAPIHLLPWQVFIAAWTVLLTAALVWQAGLWTALALLLVPVFVDLTVGNIHLLLGAAILLGFRWPWAWAFVLLTKVTPGVGLLWFAFRREWRSLAIALGATAAIAGGSFVAQSRACGSSGSTRSSATAGGPDYGVHRPDPRLVPAARCRGDPVLGRPHGPVLDGPARVVHRAARPAVQWLRDARRDAAAPRQTASETPAGRWLQPDRIVGTGEPDRLTRRPAGRLDSGRTLYVPCAGSLPRSTDCSPGSPSRWRHASAIASASTCSWSSPRSLVVLRLFDTYPWTPVGPRHAHLLGDPRRLLVQPGRPVHDRGVPLRAGLRAAPRRRSRRCPGRGSRRSGPRRSPRRTSGSSGGGRSRCCSPAPSRSSCTSARSTSSSPRRSSSASGTRWSGRSRC